MTRTTQSTIAVNQPKPRLLAAALRILMTAFLSFGLAVPFASAKCLSKGFAGPNLLPLISQAAPLPENSVEPRADQTNQPASSVSIVGLWNLTFLSGGQVVDAAFDAWHSDGTEILNDYTNPIEGNVCLGVWEQTGTRSYKLKHPSWSFDTGGNPLGTVIIRENVTVSLDGNSFGGTYTYDVYDVTGKFVVEYSGVVKATRIKPD
jgi:hypothetical protein